MLLFKIQKTSGYSKDFMYKLIDKYYKLFINEVDEKRLKKIEDLLKLLYNLNNLFNIFNICINAILLAHIIESDVAYQIVIDPTFRILKIKVANLISLINDGDLSIPAYPIFTQIEKDIEKNITTYYRLYELGFSL